MASTTGPWTFDDLIEKIVTVTEPIEKIESDIDPQQDIYMITWAPDPKRTPDVDFITQHLNNVNLLHDYCLCTSLAIFCVESTALGRPHYHGFYQIAWEPWLEQGRIALTKVLSVIGSLKITKVENAYRIFSFSAKNNALHYYKKDVVLYCFVPNSVIHKDIDCICTPSQTYDEIKSYSILQDIRMPTKYSTIEEWQRVLLGAKKYFQDSNKYMNN